MVSYNMARVTGIAKRYIEGQCLSTDQKPTKNISNGSILVEMDTGKVFMFDEEHSAWKEF